MEKTELINHALKTKSKKDGIVLMCIGMIETLHDRINMKDLQSIRWVLAKHHRKYYGLNDIKEGKDSK